MRVRVNDDRCVGHGMCFMACPQVFQLSDEDGHASVVAETVPDVYQDAVRQAQQSCPEQAVEIFQ